MSSKSISKKLVATGGQEKFVAKSSQTPSSDFLRAMLYQSDQKEAAYMVGEQAEMEFNKKNGAEIERLNLDIEDFDDRYETSKFKTKNLEEKEKSNKQFIKAAQLYSSDENQNYIGFSGWRRQDQISIVLISLCLVVAMAMGMGNIYANLIASGEPVYIDNFLITISLSALAPIGSTALKLVSSFFDYASNRKRYALCIYILSALALLVWSVFFSISFTGVSGGLNWESLGTEEAGSGALLVWIQIIAEILLAAALFLAAEEIYLKYSPDSYVENLAFINASKALKAHMVEHENLREIRNESHARLAQLNAERQVFINERIAEYLALRARFNSINSL